MRSAAWRLPVGLAGFAALLFALLALASPASAAPPASGDWVVTAPESYADQVIVIEGNVFVRAPGVLTLTNVTLEINSTAAARRGILVESGATLTTRDSDGLTATAGDRTVIRPLSASERIVVVAAPGSSIDLKQTALWGVGYTQSPINASAVYIQTNATLLENVSVYSSYFGIYFVGVTGTFRDVSVHNNTYNGLELDAAANVTVDGLLAADNGGTGVHIAGGRFAVSNASLFSNADGLAVKFDGTATASLFDASGNENGFVALNNGTLSLVSGRVTNNTLAGVDARLASRVTVLNVAFSDNPTGLYGNLNSDFSVQGQGFTRGIHAMTLRSGAAGTFTGLRVQGTTGDALDLDSSAVDFFSCLFESNAFGGSITGSTAFGFLDSTLANSTAGGFTFTNSSGIYLHNPLFFNNKGRAVDLVGTSNALLDATGVAEVNRSVVDVRSLSVLGTLRLVDATLHAVAALAWTVSGAFEASNSTVVGDVPGATLTVQSGAFARVRALTVTDFDLRLSAAAATADIDGLLHTGSGELAGLNGDYTWRNVTQGPGSGRIRAASGNLTLIGGSAATLDANASGRLDLVDFSANLGTATYAGGGVIRQFWTTEILTLWQAAVPAPYQNFSLSNAANVTVALGNTNATGRAALGPILALRGTSGGVVSSNPHWLAAGAGSWATGASVSISSAGTLTIALADSAPPSVAISAPAPGSVLSANPVVVSGSASDGESGVAALAWSFDNVSFTDGAVGDPFALSVPALFETTYQVTVRALDFAGNAAFATVSYRVDRTAPSIVLTAPANGSALRGPTVRFTGGTEVGATLTINGTVVPLDPAGDFDTNLTLPEGDLTLTLTAIDPAGNMYFLDLTLRIDSTPPAVAVDSPANGSTVAGLTVDLVGRVEPGASLSVDGVAALVASNGSFAVNVDLLAEGQNLFILRSVDRAGNANQTLWSVVRDTRAPQVAVEGLTGPGPFRINTTAPRFNISTDEYALIEASIPPAAATDSASGQALLFQPALAEGDYTLSIRTTDAAGNARVWSFAIRVDVTPPAFTLDSRTEGGFVNLSPWRVTLTAESGASVTVGGVAAAPLAPGASTYEATLNLSTGANVVAIVVVDAAGNRATRTITLTLDLTAPTLSVSSPPENLSTAEPRVTVEGDTEPGATVTVNGHAAPIDAAGHFITVVNLGFGSNRIEIVATDLAGNSEAVSRTVTRASGPRSLTGVPFLDDNLIAVLLLLALLIAGAAVASSARSKRRSLGEKAAAIERDMAAARIDRNDIASLENFSPRTVDHSDFVAAEAFRRQAAQSEAESAARSEIERAKP